MCMRATVSLSAPRQEPLHEGLSPRATVLVEGWQTDRYPNHTFDNYFITPIKMIKFQSHCRNLRSVSICVALTLLASFVTLKRLNDHDGADSLGSISSEDYHTGQ